MNLIFLTSQRIFKAVSLLIVSVFLFVQIASASHVHAEDEHSHEPNVCVVCLVPAQYDDNDTELPPSHSFPFVIPNTLSLGLGLLIDGFLVRDLEDVSVHEPPKLRLSAPRAPPV